jgi:glyoxylase-like metal-dependent hydrolase (beta-lactamase superfamily II)
MSKNNSFHFKIGQFEALAIRDSISPMAITSLFPDLSAINLQKLFNRYNFKLADIFEVICLLIRTNQHLILIDTGWGTGWNANSGKLIRILQREGIRRSEIDTIILSHGHPDHIGGNTGANQKPVFPNARYVIYWPEWEFWHSKPDLEKLDESIKRNMLAFVQKNLIPIQDRLELVDDDKDIRPGIKLIKTPGHTPGHISLAISSGSESLIYVADTFHNPLQLLSPEQCVSLDLSTEQAIVSRKQIINRAVADKTLVFACHFPFPGLGYFVVKEDVWSWSPMNS